MIQRKEYLDKLIAWKDKQIIKVVTGVRRCGKSTLFQLYIDYLKAQGVSGGQIININLEDAENEALLDYKALHEHIKSRLCEDKINYVFIDEIQQCKYFEKTADSLFIKKNVDLYITGSNAYILSGELATLLSGRYITIDMLPLSFKEYCGFTGAADIKSKFNEYLTFGSFPYTAGLNKDFYVVKPYIEGIYNTILIKDVAKREKISDITLLENIIKFLCSNIGCICSVKKIADTLNSFGRKISVNTVENYIRALTDSYIFYKADRYDIKGKQHLKTQSKYYIVDTGIKYMLLSNIENDTGHILENIVYLELLRRNYKVNIGKLAEKEIDFVALGYNSVIYYQVAASALDPKTLERELEPLKKIPDHFPKYLLTLDDLPETNYNGIKRINVIDFLLNNSK